MALTRTPVGNYYDPADPGEIGYSGRPKRRSVTDDECQILSRLATDRMVLEIGTGLAVSTRALAATAKAVVTVDPDPWVEDPKLPGVTFLRSPPDDLTGFDMAFIDGNHKTASVVADIERCSTIPTIVLHDTYLADVAEAVRICRLIELEAYDTPCRIAVYTAN